MLHTVLRVYTIPVLFRDSEFVLTNGHSDCSIVVLRSQDPAMFFKKLLQLDFIIRGMIRIEWEPYY